MRKLTRRERVALDALDRSLERDPTVDVEDRLDLIRRLPAAPADPYTLGCLTNSEIDALPEARP